MRLLLDTVTFLRVAGGHGEVSPRARDLLLDPDNETYLSTVSTWEIAIKYSLGKLRLTHRPDQFVPEHREKLATDELPLDEESALHVIRLPPLHQDPFDRILICQAIVHGMVLLTPDAVISRYPVRTAW
jgi:PIN domain nuclease of toxin-antitoxin system